MKMYCICGHPKKKHVGQTCLVYNIETIDFKKEITKEFKKCRCPCGPDPKVTLDKAAFNRWMQYTDLSTNIFFPEVLT